MTSYPQPLRACTLSTFSSWPLHLTHLQQPRIPHSNRIPAINHCLRQCRAPQTGSQAIACPCECLFLVSSDVQSILSIATILRMQRSPSTGKLYSSLPRNRTEPFVTVNSQHAPRPQSHADPRYPSNGRGCASSSYFLTLSPLTTGHPFSD